MPTLPSWTTQPAWTTQRVQTTQSPSPSAPTLVPVETEAPRTDVVPSTDDGDHDRYAHIVSKSDASMAYVTGEAITALCGKKWTPSRDPDRYPVCPSCKEILASLRSEE